MKKYFLLVAALSFSTPVYGWWAKTHKWLGRESVKQLPADQQEMFGKYRADFFRGLKQADDYRAAHHIYFDTDGKASDSSAADIADKLENRAIGIIRRCRIDGKLTNAAMKKYFELAGEITHLVTDMNAYHVIQKEDSRKHEELEKEVEKTIRMVLDEIKSAEFEVKQIEADEKLAASDGILLVARKAKEGDNGILGAEKTDGLLPMGRGDGSYIGLKQWPKELKDSIGKLLDIQVGTAACVLRNLYQKAFLEDLE